MRNPTVPGPEPDMAPPRAVRPARAALPPGRATWLQRFPASDASVAQARRFVLEHLPAGSDEAGNVALMVSELASNAVQHAGSEFEIVVTLGRAVDPDGCVESAAATVGLGPRRVRVAVSDTSAGFPVPQDPPSDAPHGRGLRVVEALADAWGVTTERNRSGKSVWFSCMLDPETVVTGTPNS